MARRTKKSRASTAAGTDKAPRLSALRKLDDVFRDRRFTPKTSARELVGVLLMSLGGVALGVGVYAQFLRDAEAEPLAWAPYVLAVGILLVVAYLLFGQSGLQPVRVGDLGVGLEQDGKVVRTSWYELESVRLVDGMLRLKTAGKPINVPVVGHNAAVRRIVAEAQKRIPRRVELDDEDLHGLGAPHDGEGESLEAEPPQVTQLHCLASNKPLTFERDVRMCRRCAALYHRTEVPRRCVECGKKLKGG